MNYYYLAKYLIFLLQNFKLSILNILVKKKIIVLITHSNSNLTTKILILDIYFRVINWYINILKD